MVVLRSREIDNTPPVPKPLTEASSPEPATPARINEPSVQSPSPALTPNLDRVAPDSVSNSQSNRRRSLRLASKSVSGGDCVQNGSSKRKRAAAASCPEEERNSDSNVKGNVDCSGGVVDGNSSGNLGLRSGKGKQIAIIDLECSDDMPVIDKSEVECSDDMPVIDKSVKIEVDCGDEQVENLISNGRDDKGKEKLVDEYPKQNIAEMTELELEAQLEQLKSQIQVLVDTWNDALPIEYQANSSNSTRSGRRMERFRDIARKNASRFAHFEPQEQQEENLPPHVDAEMPSEEERDKVEDWPGPFSTAMKIIRDRTKKFNSQQGQSTSKEAKSVPVTWVPRENRRSNLTKASAPSLLDLCMGILVKNVDAVTSLDHVPDALRHKLCQLLCDCRSMNSSFLELLLRGFPTEIRIKDCSWLTEEDFTKCFGACDTSNLSVLQLDQCGRCIADYLLPATLARSSTSMPALITLSLSGACRLTDIGLGSLLSVAPAVRSINLSQCSLLTSVGIGTLAQSLGSHLLELYIDDCQSLDVKLILPALKKLERLEVLSLAGIQAVRDDFVREFVSARGHNMKELVLTDCTNLTDASVKVIAETCPALLALDLVNLVKLTDATLGYLANSCQQIQTLKFCRNTFSDEAIAAFLETSGEPLKELSLNNVAEVGNNTALALARRSRNLEKLDLSWCRKLTDEAVGLIVDSCSSMKVLKLFGCSQITNVFLDGHSNEGVEIIGVKLTPVLEPGRSSDLEECPMRYTSASSYCNVN